MMNDLISRQAAISLAGDLQIHDDEYHMYNQAINNYCAEIMGLPPAQPETREKRTETHACDLISRQDAIDAINCDITVTGKQNAEVVAETIASFVDHIKALPPAEPERKKGKWIVDALANDIYHCSECWTDAPVEPTGGTEYKSNYCPNCGADMREVTE